jgi:hypothetical protein
MGPAAVFISYSSPDAAIAADICGALERNGHSCWIAPRDVTPGAFYADAIVSAIDAASVVLLVLSQHAAASPHVVREIERATLTTGHPVVADRAGADAACPGILSQCLSLRQG